MRAVLYCRVSTAGQNPANQELELRKACESQHWDIQAVYTDVISGAKSKRPALDRLMEAVANDEVDVICAWDVSRLGRSLQHLIALLSDIHSSEVDLYLHQQGIDTTSPSGKAMFSMMANTGTCICSNAAIPLAASADANSCGVVTITAPVNAIDWVKVI